MMVKLKIIQISGALHVFPNDSLLKQTFENLKWKDLRMFSPYVGVIKELWMFFMYLKKLKSFTPKYFIETLDQFN